ncbi:hypothetical protein [Acidocella facilis]|uniref:hypothetical protein n=1 Tax=Acidocella facilis TaxID=525 RepID=UPI001F2E63B2|nr:hypothetical protein [Acidocella facilis]
MSQNSVQQMEFNLEGSAARHCTSGALSRVWPACDLLQTKSVIEALGGMCDGMTAKQVAAYFRAGPMAQQEVERVLIGLYRLGLVYITSTKRGSVANKYHLSSR